MIKTLNWTSGVPRVSVGLPVWRGGPAVWLQLESLVRQEADIPWELVVEECESEAAHDWIHEYRGGLIGAGCVRFEYKNNRERVPLGRKWVNLARLATAPAFCFAAADNYSPPYRIQKTHDAINVAGAGWMDWTNGLFYDLNSGSHALWKRPRIRTGLFMAVKTDLLRAVDGDGPSLGIDKWLMAQIGEAMSISHEWFPAGMHTDGLNTISFYRPKMYAEKIVPPFHRAKYTPEDILPAPVWRMLQLVRAVKATSPDR